jgi:hypothetical protein
MLANGAGHPNGHSNGCSKYDIYNIEEPHLDGDGLTYKLSSDAASDEEDMGIAYCSPGVNGGGRDPPNLAMPLFGPGAKQPRHSHKHIASLICTDDRAMEPDW